jgi:hypothetical protein
MVMRVGNLEKGTQEDWGQHKWGFYNVYWVSQDYLVYDIQTSANEIKRLEY